MKWTTLFGGHVHRSQGYQIIGNVRGWEVWYCPKHGMSIIGREVRDLNSAKKLCELHRGSLEEERA